MDTIAKRVANWTRYGATAGRSVAAALVAVLLLGSYPASAIDVTVGTGKTNRLNRLDSTAAENRLKRLFFQEQQQRLREQDRDVIVRQPPKVRVPERRKDCVPFTDRGRYEVFCR